MPLCSELPELCSELIGLAEPLDRHMQKKVIDRQKGGPDRAGFTKPRKVSCFQWVLGCFILFCFVFFNLRKKVYFIFIYLYVSVCMHTCPMCVSACGDQKRMLNLL